MSVYYLITPDNAESTRQAVMAYTHGDVFKPVAGYKTMVNHFHLRFTERLRASGSLDNTFEDLMVMRSTGINIVGLSDFHGDLRPNDPGLGRFEDQRDYYVATQKASDKDFLVTNWEEPTAYFGGHYNVMFPKNVYWSKVRQAGQPFTENVPGFGKVYHTGSTTDVQRCSMPRTATGSIRIRARRGPPGIPTRFCDKPWVKNDRYLGIAFKPAMGDDLSDPRMCAWRCFDAIDTMNNLYANTGSEAEVPDRRRRHVSQRARGRHLSGPSDQLREARSAAGPDRRLDADSQVDPQRRLLGQHRGDPHQELRCRGHGRQADDDGGSRVDLSRSSSSKWSGETARRSIRRSSVRPTPRAHGTKKISIPFDATGKAWVRLSVWDSAGNGAFVQPVWLNPSRRTTDNN